MSSHPLDTSKLARPGDAQRSIPNRFCFSQYQRYESFIKDYLAAYPNPIDFHPESVAIDTFAKAFRNAVKSVLIYHWPTADLDVAKLKAIWPGTVVSTYPSGVRVGPREGPRVPESGRQVLSQSFELDTTDALAVKAAIVLCARQKFSAPVLLHGDPTEALAYIEKNSYDVSLQPAPEAGPESYRMI